MSSDSDQKPLLLRVQIAFARARFFTFSALFHVVLVGFGSGAVIFQQITVPPDFEAGDGTLISEFTI